MDYEKKYKEALVKLKEHFTTTSDGIIAGISRELTEDIFPELKESEDEKIRKELIEKVKETPACIGFNDKNAVLAWLEKQGEPADINPSEFDLRLNKLLKQFETLPKEELASSLSFYLNVVQNDGTYKADEKQGDQKPANKVESKFHEGDWVVQENIGVYKVIEVCESWYEVVDNKDKHYSIGFDKEYMCHLYTIQDANDGDVLVTPLTKGCEAGEQIFVFKGINSRDYVDNCIEYYCRICQGVFYENEIGYMGTTSETFYPATKEQRDTLMNAMADAGYTFDFEKKELKKIEPIDEYEGLTDFERTVADICIGWIGKEYGWKKYIKDNADILLKIAVEKFNSVQDATFEQKPTNEEMKELLHTEYEKGRADAISEMKNPAWSKEDEENLQGIIAEIEANKHSGPVYDIPTYDRFLSWLKSIRPQNHWKPTEAQLASLTIACDRNDRIGFDLTQLLEDLKKL